MLGFFRYFFQKLCIFGGFGRLNSDVDITIIIWMHNKIFQCSNVILWIYRLLKNIFFYFGVLASLEELPKQYYCTEMKKSETWILNKNQKSECNEAKNKEYAIIYGQNYQFCSFFVSFFILCVYGLLAFSFFAHINIFGDAAGNMKLDKKTIFIRFSVDFKYTINWPKLIESQRSD